MGIYSLSEFNGIDFGGGGSAVKSVQSGKTYMSDATQVRYISIDEVDPSKSVVIADPVVLNDGDDSNPYRVLWDGYITNPTNLTLERDRIGSNGMYVLWTVIEFSDSAFVQSGSVSDIDSSTTITISEVDKSRSLVFANYMSTDPNTYLSRTFDETRLSSSDTVFLKLPQNYGFSAHWWVVEFPE